MTQLATDFGRLSTHSAHVGVILHKMMCEFTDYLLHVSHTCTICYLLEISETRYISLKQHL